MKLEFQPQWISQPGETISALMSQRSLDSGRLAALMGLETQALRRLLAGSMDINEEIARKLAKHLGGSTSFWCTRQRQFNEALDRAVGSLKPEAANAWLDTLPISDLVKTGWVKKGKGAATIRSLCAYFGVSSPAEWRSQYSSFANTFSYRTSPSFENKLGALSVWLRQAEIEAGDIACEGWDRDKLSKAVFELRRLTKQKNPSSFIPKLRSLCSVAGVALVFMRAPSGCAVSGATRFISADKAMIVMSFRHLSEDHFWFTLFHEIGHLLLHGRAATFVDGDAADSSKKENEANSFAAQVPDPRQASGGIAGPGTQREEHYTICRVD